MNRSSVSPEALLGGDSQGALDGELAGQEVALYTAESNKDRMFKGMVGGSSACVVLLAIVLFPIALFTGFVWWILFVASSVISVVVMLLLMVPKKIEVTETDLKIVTYVPKLAYKASLRDITSAEQVSPFTDVSQFRALTAPLVTSNKNIILVRTSGTFDFLISPKQHAQFLAQLREQVDKRKFGEA